MRSKGFKRFAFSVAEALMALLIVSCLLAACAPLFSQRIKKEVNTSTEVIPAGAVMFFNLNSCPDGWRPIQQEWNGRFPRFAGQYTISGYDNGAFNENGITTTINTGETSEDAIRNIQGSFVLSGDLRWPLQRNEPVFEGVFEYLNDDTRFRYAYDSDGTWVTRVRLNSGLVVPTADEIRPKNVALLGCEKE